MNSDNKKIYDAIVDNGNRLTRLETLQREQHKVNTKEISIIKEDNKNFIEKHANTSGQIKAQWVIIIIILAGMLSTAWKVLK